MMTGEYRARGYATGFPLKDTNKTVCFPLFCTFVNQLYQTRIHKICETENCRVGTSRYSYNFNKE